MLRSRLGSFATEFDHAVRPFLTSLGRAVDGLDGEGGELLAREVLLGLLHARERLQAISKDVADRRGAVLVLGPSKSGKSTLINALSGANVTKATALPTYPAISSIRHAESFGVQVETYGREVETFDDPVASRSRLQRAEARLPQLIRDIEETGDEFQPDRHANEALRRIRVSLPVDALARSGVAFHEIPADRRFALDRGGFYDEFEGSPLAAVVVLRPADLFAPIPFPRLETLLERCGTVFVVVNLDRAARRLEGDGGLADEVGPTELREAFARTATGAWHHAANEGQLRFAALDLLTAAQVRFGAVEGDDAAIVGLAQELIRHLDEASLTRMFCAENLRSSTALTERVAGLCQASSIVDIRERLGERKDQRTEAMRQKDAMDRLGRLEPREWDSGGALAPAHEAMVQSVRARSAHHYEALSRSIASRLGDWFASNDGLDVLVRKDVGPLFAAAQKEIAAVAKSELVRIAERDTLVDELPAGIRNDLDYGRIRFGELARAAAEGLDVVPALPPLPVPLRMDDIPVKKSWSDRLLARRMPTVRKRNLDAPDLSGEWKASRLEEGAQEHIQDLLDKRAVRFVAERGETICSAMMEAFLAGLTHELGAKLTLRRDRFDPRLEEVEASVEELERVRDQIADLERASKTVHESLADLNTSYVSIARRDAVIPPTPPPSMPAARSLKSGSSSDAG